MEIRESFCPTLTIQIYPSGSAVGSWHFMNRVKVPNLEDAATLIIPLIGRKILPRSTEWSRNLLHLLFLDARHYSNVNKDRGQAYIQQAFVQKILHTGLIRFMVPQAISDCMTLVLVAKLSYYFLLWFIAILPNVLLSDENCIRNFYAMVST